MGVIYQELDTIHGTLRGFLHKPNTDHKVPIVILYHGFTGSKNSNNFLFGQFSKYLESRNIASIRFDFIGTGDSDGDFQDMTFTKELLDASNILDYVKTLSFVSKIIVLGLSMGGALAAQLCKSRINDVDKLILWAPAGNMSEYAKKADESATSIENDNYDLGGIELSKECVDELKNLNLFQGIEVFEKPVAIFQGSEDIRVPVSIAKKYHKLYKNSVLHLIENGDHTFNSLAIRERLFEMNTEFIQNG